MMQVKLIVVGGKANKREVTLNLPATIGRSRDADLTVGHRMVSRNHCEVFPIDGLMMIRDVGSLNGTFVRGCQIRKAPLPPGAKFTIGPITFRVEYEYSGDPSELPPIVPVEGSLEETPVAAEPSARGSAKPEKKQDQTEPVGAGVEEDEPDFQIVEDDEDDFELAFQESLDEGSDVNLGQPNKKPSDDEVDPEDQLMDDFLNDIQ